MPSEIIGGINPVLEALRARGGMFRRIYAARGRGGPALKEIMDLARSHGVGVQRVDRSRLDKMFGKQNHQGVVAQVDEYQYYSLEDILEKAGPGREIILVLDGVQDPMNLGSLIRSADAAGALGIIIPRERSAPVTSTAMKASAGASEHVPVARAVNLPRTLDAIKQAGFWVMGADASAPGIIYEQDLNLKLALVVGGEGKGLSRLVKEKCDLLVSIPLKGKVSSLNAAVAGALAMFEFVRQAAMADK